MDVGYVGLGSMGGGIAKRLLLKRKLRLYDLAPERVSALAGEGLGGVPAQSLPALAAECEMVCLCLPTSDHVRTAVFGENGLAGGLKAGTLVADMTSGDPLATKAMAKELATKGVEMIDAPVSGGPAGAAAGTLAIMVGGTAAQFERARAVFEQVSPNVFHMGEVGAGHTMKAVNNLSLAACKAITFEVMALGAKNGIDPRKCAEVLQKSSGRNSTTEALSAPGGVLDGEFRKSFTLALMHKDVKTANQLGQDTGVPMLIGRLVQELYQVMLTERGGDIDVNFLIRDFEDRAGVRVTKG